MSENDIIKYINEQYTIEDVGQIQYDLRNLEILTFFNNNWGIQLLQFDGDDNKDNSNNDNKMEIIQTMDDLNTSKTIGLFINNPNLPWSCYLYKKITTLIELLIVLLFIFIIIYMIFYLYKKWRMKKQKDYEDELQIIVNIIDIFQANANDDNYFLPINHLRDMLIPINERNKKEKLWPRVIEYINKYESRIRTEIQSICGEPTEVWRWLGNNKLNKSDISILNKSSLTTSNTHNNNINKVWQGQAFETQTGSVNSLPCSPTSCLKIRGMFEEGERNLNEIKKAVLIKCSDKCRILDCVVDPKMSCVYLKCVDTDDAAVAYTNLHGWWYAGNLVTVKYIRLERFMQRFPDSPSNGPYLEASSAC